MKKFGFVAALSACVVALISVAPAADMPKPDESKRILPTINRFEVKQAIERTPEQMAEFDATFVSPGQVREVAIRPTMDETQYAAMKQAANQASRGASRPGVFLPDSPLAAITKKFGGATQCDGPGGCWIPPDVAGAVGKSQFVSVSNDVFEVRSKGGTLLQTKSLNGLFGYSTESMFDPRVQYDEEYQRWIVTADAFEEPSGTVQIFGIAVSKTNSATGSWYIYFLNTNGFTGNGSLYDYPMLGMTQDALLFTANIFTSNGFAGSDLFSVAKARVYNGFGFGVPVFTGLTGTMQTAHQLLTDQNGYAWFAAAPGNSGTIQMVAESFPANPGQTGLFGYYSVSGVAAYSIPPSAAQPAACGGATLDSLDNRFQQAGTQNGDLYYQTHTVSFGTATVKYYVISGLSSFAPAVSLSNFVYKTGSSSDWNPSIAADPEGRFGLDWSSADPGGANQLPSEYFADNNGTNPGPGSGLDILTGTSCYNTGSPQRWGDYSQVTVDPGTGTVSNTNTGIFWGVNEIVNSLNFWTTEIANIKY
jgi:hypothetical protein